MEIVTELYVDHQFQLGVVNTSILSTYRCSAGSRYPLSNESKFSILIALSIVSRMRILCLHAQFIANMADDNDVVDVFDATMSADYNETIDLPDGETDCRPKLSKLPNKKALV